MFIHIYIYMFFHHAYSLLLFYEILDMYSYVIHIFYIVFRGLNMHMHIFVKGLGFPRFLLQLHQSLFEEDFDAFKDPSVEALKCTNELL
jgi:hypothetical protein